MRSYRGARRFHRFVRRSAATRAGARVYGVIQHPIDRAVHRLTGGRTTATSWLAGVEITMLTTTGARTGLPRTVPVLGLPDGDALIVIASNFGRLQHPSWYVNLRADPQATVEVGGARHAVIAHELRGEERYRAYHRGEEVFPGFTRYPVWASGREIPVLRLERVRAP